MSFVTSLTALIVSVVAGIICFFVLLGSTDMSDNQRFTVLIIFLVPICIAAAFVIGLCGYHIFLRIMYFYFLCRGKTTRENLKHV